MADMQPSPTTIPLTVVGQPGGVAQLDGSGFVPDGQIPPGVARDSEVTAAIAGKQDVVVHGSTANTARPAAATVVHWIGSVAPTNVATNDEWTDTVNKLVKRWNGASFDSLGSAASGAGLPTNFLTKTTAYTATAGDYVLADGTTAGFTVTLPTAPATGALVAVEKTDATTNVITVAPAGGGTVGGDANATILAKSAWIFEHQGSNAWRVAAGNGGATGGLSLEGTNAPPTTNTTGSVLGTATTAAHSDHTHAVGAHDHSTTAKGGQITPTTGLAATGTPSATTFLRGDNTWGTPAGGGGATALASGHYGDASDGTVTVTGGTTTLSRDMFYDTLTVTGTGVLFSNGYRVFVANTLTVNSGGIIHNDGAAGASNAGGSFGNAGTVIRSQAGANGNTGAGASGTGSGNALGGAAGTGGTGSGGAGGAGGTVTAATAGQGVPRHMPNAITASMTNGTNYGGGAGGGAGGGDGSNPGGGGGAGGGAIVVAARILVNNGIIRSAGGNGANRAVGNVGGGGAGGGGLCIVVTSAASGSGTVTAPGGTGGTGFGTGTTGGNGSAGLALTLVWA